MEVWSVGCDGGRAVLPDRCHAVCGEAAGSGEPCDTTRDFSGPGTSTSVIAHVLHMFVHMITGRLCLFMFQKLEAWETVSEMVAELTEMVGI